MTIRERALFVCCSITIFATLGFSSPADAQQAEPATLAAPLSGQVSNSLSHLTTPIAPGIESSSTTPTNATSGPMFGHLLKDSFGDFRRLASKENATWLAIGAAIALYGHTMDRPVTAELSRPGLERPFVAGDRLGAGMFQIGSAFATYTIGHLAGKPRVAAVGGDLLRAQILTKTMTTVLKVAVKRARPVGTPYSYPTGHTSAAFEAATVLKRHVGW